MILHRRGGQPSLRSTYNCVFFFSCLDIQCCLLFLLLHEWVRVSSVWLAGVCMWTVKVGCSGAIKCGQQPINTYMHRANATLLRILPAKRSS